MSVYVLLYVDSVLEISKKVHNYLRQRVKVELKVGDQFNLSCIL